MYMFMCIFNYNKLIIDFNPAVINDDVINVLDDETISVT